MHDGETRSDVADTLNKRCVSLLGIFARFSSSPPSRNCPSADVRLSARVLRFFVLLSVQIK